MGVLESRLENGEVIILDGAMATELQRRGVDLHREAWSAGGLLNSPETVRAVHEDYIKAGAEIITANTFSCGQTTLELAGIGERTAELNTLAVKLAQEARGNVKPERPVLIAGSMSGVEPWYDLKVTPPLEVARSQYQEQAELLAKAGADIILVECMTRIFDTEVAVEAGVATGLPTWVGLACQFNRGKLFLGIYGERGTETITQAVEKVGSKGASAMFVMHTFPQHTALGLNELKEHWSLSIGAYANIGDLDSTVPTSSKASPGKEDVEGTLMGFPYSQWEFTAPWDFSKAISPQEYVKYAQEWVNMGTQIIGGCCGTTPEHIRELKAHLPTRVPQ